MENKAKTSIYGKKEDYSTSVLTESTSVLMLSPKQPFESFFRYFEPKALCNFFGFHPSHEQTPDTAHV